jgi:hypothetical protein
MTESSLFLAAPMLPSPKRNPVRSFREDDLPQVADLHRTVFAIAKSTTPELLDEYRNYFDRVFLNNPWRDGAVGPLVYEDPAGRITGFMGVMPRRLQIAGQPVQLAIMSQFVVDEGSRGMPGMKLMSALFAGPQDVTISDEASTAVRAIWEGFGGHTSVNDSMRWYYAVRPCHFALMVLRKVSGLPIVAQRKLAPLARGLDALSARILKFPYRPARPDLVGEELTCETLLDQLAQVGGKHWLRPDYDLESLDWTLRRAASLRRDGSFQKVLVKTADGKIAGWYLYYLNPAGVSQVVQIHANHPHTSQVLDHLLYHAWQNGASVLSGRLETSRHFTQAFSDKHFVFHCGPDWALFHSRRPELVSAFQRGEVFLSRLEGEWCTHLR